MLQHQGSVQLPLIGAFLLCLLVVGGALLAWRWFAQSESSDNAVTKHTVDTPAEDVLKYWTGDKMRRTKATNMPHVGTPRRKKPHPLRPPRTPGQQS